MREPCYPNYPCDHQLYRQRKYKAKKYQKGQKPCCAKFAKVENIQDRYSIKEVPLTPARPCPPPPPQKNCNRFFRKTLQRAICQSQEIRTAIERLYLSSTVATTDPLDRELVATIQDQLATLELDIEDLLLTLNPCDFICEETVIRSRLINIPPFIETAEALLSHIVALKESTDQRQLCLAEESFTNLLRTIDPVVRDLFFIELVYACDSICS